MHWTDEYLSPNIEKDKFKFKRLIKAIHDFFVLIDHALSFHKKCEEPLKTLPDIQTENQNLAYDVCKSFYKDSNERINDLEEKSNKLLLYISAIFAFISFMLTNIQSITSKYLLLSAMIFLILSIIISFRCVNVKGRKAFFLPDIYDFSSVPPVEAIEMNLISSKLRDYAIYNHSIADNTADLVRASRYFLTLGIIVSIIALLISFPVYKEETEKLTKVELTNQMDLKSLQDELNRTNVNIDSLITVISEISNDQNNYLRLTLNNKIKSLTNELNQSKNENVKLVERIKNIENRLNNFNDNLHNKSD